MSKFDAYINIDGKKIRELRIKSGLSNTRFGMLIGYSSGTVWRIETGK